MSDSEKLHRAVAALIETSRLRVWREDTKRGEWQIIPSLWDQLQDAIAYSGKGGPAIAKSKPPITTGVVSLIIEIADATAEAALDVAKVNHRSAPANLRAVAANLEDQDQIECWASMVNGWVGKARGLLQLEPHVRYARGVKCVNCGADTITERNDERENVKTPAIAINWTSNGEPDDYKTDDDWKVRAIECRACGAVWWRGPELDTLIDQIFAQQRQETLAVVAEHA